MQPLEVGKVIVAIGDAENDHSFMRLAECPEDIERRIDLGPAQTRALVRATVEARYTLPE